MRTLADRVRGVLNVPLPAQRRVTGGDVGDPGLQKPASMSRSSLAEVLRGGWTTRDSGQVFVVEQRWSGHEHYGNVRVDQLAQRIEQSGDYASLMTSGAPVGLPFVFFDLETTGLSGGAGTYAFLVGCGSFEASGDFVTRQFLLPGFADEKPMLEAVSDELARAGALISFNGKSFDAPVLETRFLFHRLGWAADIVPHVDVLHSARRFWGERSVGAGRAAVSHPSMWDEPVKSAPPFQTAGTSLCTLGSLERDILGTTREGDVPGFEIPGRYFAFVRSGDARPLAAVLDHNRLDLLSLAGLMARLLHLVAEGATEARSPGEALALGRVYARAGLDGRARDAFTRAVGMVRLPEQASLRIGALRALAQVERKSRRYIAAAARWAEILAVPNCPTHIAREATEALAIHHEHRLRDFDGARAFAMRSLAAGARGSWQESVRHRLARIERKLAGRTSGSLPFASSPWPPSPWPSVGPTSGPRTSS
jgi:uncharacterized protein YprB with RNaseH-like and TPR domain